MPQRNSCQIASFQKKMANKKQIFYSSLARIFAHLSCNTVANKGRVVAFKDQNALSFNPPVENKQYFCTAKWHPQMNEVVINVIYRKPLTANERKKNTK